MVYHILSEAFSGHFYENIIECGFSAMYRNNSFVFNDIKKFRITTDRIHLKFFLLCIFVKKVNMNERVYPDDVIVVPESYF